MLLFNTMCVIFQQHSINYTAVLDMFWDGMEMPLEPLGVNRALSRYVIYTQTTSE